VSILKTDKVSDLHSLQNLHYEMNVAKSYTLLNRRGNLWSWLWWSFEGNTQRFVRFQLLTSLK